MNVYSEIALLSVAVIYIVDASGFTQSWRSLLARFLHTKEESLRALPPFDCSTCAVWWAGVILALCRGQLTFGTIAMSAGCSLLAMPAGMLMGAVRDLLATLVGRIRL